MRASQERQYPNLTTCRIVVTGANSDQPPVRLPDGLEASLAPLPEVYDFRYGALTWDEQD